MRALAFEKMYVCACADAYVCACVREEEMVIFPPLRSA